MFSILSGIVDAVYSGIKTVAATIACGIVAIVENTPSIIVGYVYVAIASIIVEFILINSIAITVIMFFVYIYATLALANIIEAQIDALCC